MEIVDIGLKRRGFMQARLLHFSGKHNISRILYHRVFR